MALIQLTLSDIVVAVVRIKVNVALCHVVFMASSVLAGFNGARLQISFDWFSWHWKDNAG